MNGANYRKIKRYLMQEEIELTNNIIKAIDDLEQPKNAAISEQIWLKKNITSNLDRLDTIKNNYKTISELYLNESE